MIRENLLAVICLLATTAATTPQIGAQKARKTQKTQKTQKAETASKDQRPQVPDPDGKPAKMRKKVQVFIMLGQSNMLGFGRIAPEDKNGTLSHAVKEGKYPHLVDESGEWTE